MPYIKRDGTVLLYFRPAPPRSSASTLAVSEHDRAVLWKQECPAISYVGHYPTHPAVTVFEV